MVSNLCYSKVTKKHFTAIASDNSMLTHCSQISVNNGSGNDFLPGDTKPFPKLMLTYHYLCKTAVTPLLTYWSVKSYVMLFCSGMFVSLNRPI